MMPKITAAIKANDSVATIAVMGSVVSSLSASPNTLLILSRFYIMKPAVTAVKAATLGIDEPTESVEIRRRNFAKPSSIRLGDEASERTAGKHARDEDQRAFGQQRERYDGRARAKSRKPPPDAEQRGAHHEAQGPRLSASAKRTRRSGTVFAS